MSQNLPYIAYGIIKDSSSVALSGVKVQARNDTNGETISVNTNSSGQYAMDLGNLTSGYDNNDRITIVSASGLESKSSSFLISSNTHEVNLTLAVDAASADLTYCQVQDVLDELGEKTTTDISYARIRKIVLRAESEIDERCDSTFKTTVVTKELYDFNQYTSWKSPEQLRSYGSDSLTGTRNDFYNTFQNDKLKLENFPVITSFTQLNGVTTTTATTLTVDSTSGFPTSGTIFIYNSTNGTEAITYTGTTSTTFTGCTRAANSTTATAHADNSYVTMVTVSRNGAGMSSADTWTDLEPQVGGGGSFIVDGSTGIVTFVDNLPSLGFRKIRSSYTYGKVSVPKVVERLCILLSVRDVIISKSNSSQFDSINDIRLESISIRSGIGSTVSYFNWLVNEINRLWATVGEMTSSGA